MSQNEQGRTKNLEETIVETSLSLMGITNPLSKKRDELRPN